MRKLFLSLMIGGSLLLPLGVAQAEQSLPVNASYTGCETIISERTVKDKIHAVGFDTDTWTGTFAGSDTGIERDVIYPDGSVSFKGRITFVGVVAGKAGSFLYSFEGFAPSSGPYLAHWVISDGSGGLVGIEGKGTEVGQILGPTPECALPYAGASSGQIQFEQSSRTN
jgi:hypothetical protein